MGDHHPLLCQTYASQSVIESLRGHEEKALEYNQLAMEICRVRTNVLLSKSYNH